MLAARSPLYSCNHDYTGPLALAISGGGRPGAGLHERWRPHGLGGYPRRSAPDEPDRGGALEHDLGDQVVGDDPGLVRWLVEIVAKDRRERGEERAADGLVVGGPDAVARVPGPERAGVADKFVKPRDGVHDLGELRRELDLQVGHVGGEQRPELRRPLEQLPVEPR